jgi:hypothetical protein
MLPKHSSYFDYLEDVREDPYYKVLLTVEGHSCQHDILYQVFHFEGDRIARDTLLSQLTRDEAISQARADWIRRNPTHHSEAGKKGGKARAKLVDLNRKIGEKWGKGSWKTSLVE